jgi:hypothetical protein
MIDTDEYEGHTKGEWKLCSYFSGWKIYWFDKETSDNWDSIRDFGEEYRHEDFCYDVGVIASTKADAQLMADAPLLLEEVKRLRERIDEFGLATMEAVGCMESNGVIDEELYGWLYNHLNTLLWPKRYHVEGKKWNHDACEWEEEE